MKLKNDQYSIKKKIKPGESIPNCDMPGKNLKDIFFAIQIKKLKKSGYFNIITQSNKINQSKICEIAINLNKNKKLKILIENSLFKNGQRIIKFYCLVWFINLTGLPIQYKKIKILGENEEKLPKNNFNKPDELKIKKKPPKSKKSERVKEKERIKVNGKGKGKGKGRNVKGDGINTEEQEKFPINKKELKSQIPNHKKIELFGEDQANLQIYNSELSKLIKLNVPGNVFPIKFKYRGKIVEIGCKIERAPDEFNRSLIVILSPRYFIINKYSKSIKLIWFVRNPTKKNANSNKSKNKKQERDQKNNENLKTVLNDIRTIKPNETIPLFIKSNQVLKESLQISIVEYNWSPPIFIDSVGSQVIKIWNKKNSSWILLNCIIKIEESTVFIIFKDQHNLTPKYFLSNQTPIKFKIWQKEGKFYEYLNPNRETMYYWENSRLSHTLVLYSKNDHFTIEIKLDKKTFKKKNTIGKDVYEIHLFKSGPTTFLKISKDFNNDQCTLVESETKKIINSKKVKQSIFLNFAALGFSISTSSEDLLYVTFLGTQLHFEDSNIDQLFELNLDHFQIDNQLILPIFPVIVRPTNLNNVYFKKFFTVLYQREKYYGNINYFTTFTVLLRVIEINAEEEFISLIFKIINMSNLNKLIERTLSVNRGNHEGGDGDEDEDKGEDGDEDEDGLEGKNIKKGDELTKKKTETKTKTKTRKNIIKFENTIINEKNYLNKLENYERNLVKTKQFYYFQNLKIFPIQLLFNFEMSKTSVNNPIKNFGRVLGASFASIHGETIHLYPLELSNYLSLPELLTDLLNQHYRKEFLFQAYKILSGSDLIGAPVYALRGIGKGMSNFWEEPAKGITQSPFDFVKGLQKGSYNAVSHVAEGVAGTINHVFDSIGSGFSVLSFDHDFQKQRQRELLKKPKHVGDGLVQGASSFGKNIWSGVSGIVTQPISNYKKSGKRGILSGLGKGVVGAVAKPLIGVTDLISKVSTGVMNTASILHPQNVDRFRLPRIIQDGKLVPYNNMASLGSYILKSNKNYSSEKLTIARMCKAQENSVVIISTNYIFFVINREIKWSLRLKNIISCSKIDNFTLLLKFDKSSRFNSKNFKNLFFDKSSTRRKIFKMITRNKNIK